MESAVCPFCSNKQNHKLIKEWYYGIAKVSRFKCKCKKSFNYYKNPQRSWTVPKKQ